MTTQEISELKKLTEKIEGHSTAQRYELIGLFKEIKKILLPYYNQISTDHITTLVRVLEDSILNLENLSFHFNAGGKKAKESIATFNRLKNAPIMRLRLLFI